ncbi:MAG: PIN domain-containing protein [Thermoguttaceae bacterium]|jgi:predicted nucleic acid-binding protein|nr:PIN domain-containing protein [Thermoguttaceae bacterium]
MTGRRLIDTNIAIYAYDSSAGHKQTTAQQVLREAAATREGVISIQVLGECFHATVSRKNLLPVGKARLALAALRQLEVVRVDEAMVDQAINFHERFQLRYWDALIVATAKLSRCGLVVSEDFSDGQDCDGVTVVNPFRKG